jgi:hypothetical protein
MSGAISIPTKTMRFIRISYSRNPTISRKEKKVIIAKPFEPGSPAEKSPLPLLFRRSPRWK